MLALVAGFSGMVTWPSDLLEGNISAIDILVYEDIKEVSSFVTTLSSSLAFEWGVMVGCQSFSITGLARGFCACGGRRGSTTNSYF